MKRQFNVTPHRPWRHGLLALVALAALTTSGWLLFERGKVQAGYDTQAWIDLESQLRQQILALEHRNADLVRENAVLQRSADIDRNAYIEVQKALSEAQTVTLGLREELSFYRGLVTPSDKVDGLHVERLRLQPTARERRFQYMVTLTQVRKNDRFATGEVNLRVSGARGDQEFSYTLADLSDVQGVAKFRFKYFQDFEGTIELPDGFVPESVLVEVKPSGKRLQPVSKRFAWKSLVTGGN
jgi:hypothetical protein